MATTNSPNANPSQPLGKVKQVKLSDITLDKTFRCRTGEKHTIIEEYAEVFTEYKNAKEADEDVECPFPAVVVWEDDKKNDGVQYLIAGFHRYKAAKKAGVEEIPTRKFTGSKEDALYFAIQDNRKHGLRMSFGDMKHAIANILKLYPNKTPGTIAKATGYSKTYVYRVHDKLTESGELEKPEKRVGGDGKEYPVKRAGKQTPKPSPEVETELASIIKLLSELVKRDTIQIEDRKYIYKRLDEWVKKKRAELPASEE